MLAKQIEFRWEITNDRVNFSVYEPYEHSLVVFLRDYCEANKKMPSLNEWMVFYKKVKAPKSVMEKKIKLFNKNKKNQEKMQIIFDKIYSKDSIPKGRAKKVVKKKS